MTMNVACSVAGCTNPVIGQCVGYKGSCGRYYCASHSSGKLCADCAEQRRHDEQAERIYQDYLQAAASLDRARRFQPLAIYGVVIFAAILIGLAIQGSSQDAGNSVLCVGVPLAVMLAVTYGFILKKRRLAELSATRPRFEEFYRAYAKQKTKEQLGKTLAVAGVLGGIALAVAATRAKDRWDD